MDIYLEKNKEFKFISIDSIFNNLIDISLPNVSDCSFTSASGNIQIIDMKCNSIKVENTSGDIILTEVKIDKQITAESTSGDIDLSFALTNNCKATLNNTSGDIILNVENANNINVDKLSTISGSKSISHNGSGKYQLNVNANTVSGDIEIN